MGPVIRRCRELADSNITKKALATSLKNLMEEKPFEKISIADICERCDMNRKSFYYHFKDKYDLVNWIFDTEFIAVARKKNYGNAGEILGDICEYFHENRSFYRKALSIQGQNSFSEHFTDRLKPAIRGKQRTKMGDDLKEFHVLFFSDAFMCAMGRWLSDRNCMPPDDFVDMLTSCIWQTAVKARSDTGTDR